MRSFLTPSGRGFVLLGVLIFGSVFLLSGSVLGQADQVTGSDQAHTTLEISIQPDGDAVWSVTMRFDLDPDETDAFDRLAREFEAGESEVLPLQPFAEAASLASDETGRSMSIQNASRSANRSDSRGYLVLSFEWTDFARVRGDQMVLGDVFQNPTGTWLPRLGENQELIIEFPEEFAVRSSSRALTNGSFYVEGPAQFEAGRPFAELERTGGLGPDTPDETVIPLALGIGGVLIVVVAIAVLLARRNVGTSTGAGGIAEPDGEVPEQGTPEGTPQAEEESAEPLLSDEERVIRLLEGNGGRMKQVDIVTETDWSNAKVSQLLSEMESKDVIDKLRIGRENLISLPDESLQNSE